MSVPIHWYSRTKRSVSMSSTKAEYFAMCAAAKEIVFFRDLLLDLGIDLLGPTHVATDNRIVVDLAFNAVSRRPNTFSVLLNSSAISLRVAFSTSLDSWSSEPCGFTHQTFCLSYVPQIARVAP